MLKTKYIIDSLTLKKLCDNVQGGPLLIYKKLEIMMITKSYVRSVNVLMMIKYKIRNKIIDFAEIQSYIIEDLKDPSMNILTIKDMPSQRILTIHK